MHPIDTRDRLKKGVKRKLKHVMPYCGQHLNHYRHTKFPADYQTYSENAYQIAAQYIAGWWSGSY
ncbi:MAG: hypothetical protein ACTSRK_21140 [Promethearchaeota archaeon]